MSTQARILEEMQTLVMTILKNGSATEAEGEQIDKLEVELFQQKCFEETEHKEFDFLGEEIAQLFHDNHTSKAIEKMNVYKISLDDFFSFIDYHFDEEPLLEKFTFDFRTDIAKAYQAKN